MSEETQDNKLTPKQKLFADYYVGEARQNATKAAKLAGYSEHTAYSSGSRLLKNVEVSDYIAAALKEKALSAETVLSRLTDIANGDVTDFLDAEGRFDLRAARENGKTPLIKKLKQKRTLKQRKTEIRDDMRGFLAEDEVEDLESETEIIYEEVEFEMYSAHEALRDLGKYHKLFTDKVEHGGAVEVAHKQATDLSKFTDEELEAWEKLLKKANG